MADDLRDALYDAETLGKPAGQDAVHGRPECGAPMGVQGAIRHLKDILGGAIASIPSCPGEAHAGRHGARLCRADDAGGLGAQRARATGAR